MRLNKANSMPVVLAAVTIFALYTSSLAQQPPVQRNQRRTAATGATTTNPMVTAHRTFEQAARVMESALPIYDGHRARSIRLAHMAAMEIKEAARGGSSAAAGTGTGTGANGTSRKTAAQRAAEVPKGKEALSNYSAAQIAASNVKMQQGLKLLQQAISQVQAIGNDAAGHMNDAAEFGNYSMQAANSALTWIAGK